MHEAADQRRRFAEAASFVLPLALYLSTLAPTVTLEDSGEFITVAHTLGIAHPPGYPLWTLLAHAFTWIPVGTIAQRVHFSSAFFAAASCWVLFRIARGFTKSDAAALAGALAVGASAALWSQAIIAEVYALNALLTAIAFWLALKFSETRGRRWVVALAFALGIGMTNHHLAALAALPLGAWALFVDRKVVLAPRTLAPALLALLVGLSLYAYLPLRARQDPPVNWGQPTTFEKTLAHVRRDEYRLSGRASAGARDVALHSFDAAAGVGRDFTWPLALFALGGLVFGRFPRGLRLASLVFFLLVIVGLNVALRDPFVSLWRFDHRVYYIPAHLMVGLWVAAGVAAVRERGPRALRWSCVPLAAAATVGCVAVHWDVNDRHADTMARQFGLDFLRGVPPGAGVLAWTDTVVFPLLYLRDVERVRTDFELLDPNFGWDGRRTPSVVATVPMTPRFEAAFPELKGYQCAVVGLGYVLTPPGAPAPAPFTPLVPPPTSPAPTKRFDPFAADVRSFYAAYHARDAERLAASGDLDGAKRALEEAERLNPDAYALSLIARARRRTGIEVERARPLLEEARRFFDSGYDPVTMALYPLTPEALNAQLAELAP